MKPYRYFSNSRQAAANLERWYYAARCQSPAKRSRIVGTPTDYQQFEFGTKHGRITYPIIRGHLRDIRDNHHYTARGFHHATMRHRSSVDSDRRPVNCTPTTGRSGWGPKRDNVWRENGLLESFPEGGPPSRVAHADRRRLRRARRRRRQAVRHRLCHRGQREGRQLRPQRIHRHRTRAVPRCRDRQGNLEARVPGKVHDFVSGRPALHAHRRRRQSVHARRRGQSHLLRRRHRRHRLAKGSAARSTTRRPRCGATPATRSSTATS